MQPSAQETRILGRVLEMLGSGKALSQDLEEYIIGYSVLGNFVAIAQGEYETAEMEYKIGWAEAFAAAKSAEDKASDALARSTADIAGRALKVREIRKHEQLTKLKGTRDSVQEAIWGIKHLGKNGG